MNTRTPLAAALLMIAATAAAQSLNPGAGAGTGFSFGGTGGTAFNSYATGPASTSDLDDAAFDCSSPYLVHIPYASCTEAQLQARSKFNGICSPTSKACKGYVERTLSGTNPAAMIGAYTLPPGREWASPNCTRIPCALAPDPKAAASSPTPTPAGQSYEDAPGFIGPPSPFRTTNAQANTPPPPMSDSEFQQTMDSMRKTHGDDAIDLGNNTYGILQKDGRIQVCNSGGCIPHDQSEYADKIQQAQAERVGFTGSSGGGQTSTGGSTPGIDNAGRTGSPDQAAADNNPSDEAKGFGRQAAADSRAVSGTSAPSSGGGSAVASRGFSAGEATAEDVIKTRGAELDDVYTFHTTQKVKATIDRTAGEIKGGADGTFATGANTPDANAGNLEFKGTQSSANK